MCSTNKFDFSDAPPLFSIIAPNLNEAKRLPYFLKSLLDQTMTDFEVIIVDGGSSDDSIKILKQYAPAFAFYKIPFRVVEDKTPNLGYIRNVGASFAGGDIFFNCNTDNVFAPDLLDNLLDIYMEEEDIVSVSGRVYPIGSSIIAKCAYQLFDLVRYICNRLPFGAKKYCPSGNFCTVARCTFFDVHGYPELPVNEDGEFGLKLNRYNTKFCLNLHVGHFVKKFEQMGGVSAFLFYLYVVANFLPFLRRFLSPVKERAAATFQHKREIKQSFFKRLWAAL